MTRSVRLAITFAVLGSFAVAGLLVLHTETPARAIGVLLLGGGLTAIVFARSLGTAPESSADAPGATRFWPRIRPTTFILWGSGVTLIGILQLTVF